MVGGLKESSDIVAGDRQDNQWLQYNSGSLPRTQQDWDSCVFVEKTHWGYYCWPRFSLECLLYLQRTHLFTFVASAYLSVCLHLSNNIFHMEFIYCHLMFGL